MSLPVPVVTAAHVSGDAPPQLAGELNAQSWAVRELYGGAISCAMPKRFVDVSDFRQIPNHQEVWADADTDQSIIIELNSLDEEISDEEAAAHYQRDLGEANEALSLDVLQTGIIPNEDMPGFDADIHKSFCITNQRISKFKESADKANVVQIYLCVLRLRRVTTDLLLSFNVPLQFAAGSSSEGRSIMQSEENLAVIRGVLKTLQIKDWGLFK